jgi:hypothetical protein
MYSALYRLNVESDFVTPESYFSPYKVLLITPLYSASDTVLEKVVHFVEKGGHVVMTVKSGFANEHSTVRSQRAPGPLRKAAGLSYREFSSLVSPIGLEPDRYRLGSQNRVHTWAEFLLPEMAEVLARYQRNAAALGPGGLSNKQPGSNAALLLAVECHNGSSWKEYTIRPCSKPSLTTTGRGPVSPSGIWSLSGCNTASGGDLETR